MYSSETKKGNLILLGMCRGGTLEDLVRRNQGLPYNQVATCISRLLQTTKYIHGKGLFLLPTCFQQQQQNDSSSVSLLHAMLALTQSC